MSATTKKLYRTKQGAVLGGVCSGIGAYFLIDPVIVRVLFIFFLFTGIGFLAYLIALIIVPLNPKNVVIDPGYPISEKSRLGAILFCLILGCLGVHRYYVGKIGTGLLMLFTLGGLGIWTVIDFIMILIGSFSDKNSQKFINW